LRIGEVVNRWLDVAMPHRQGSQIGKVLSFNSGPGTNRYSARVRVLKPGNLEETKRILEDVPASPLWAGPRGTGLYAPLPRGTLVIVGYIEHNPSHPYIQALWGELHSAADFQPDEFLITNGAISVTIKAEELLLNGDSLGGLIKIDELTTNLRKNELVLDAMQKAINSSTSPVALLAALKPSALLPLGDFSNMSIFQNSKVKHG